MTKLDIGKGLKKAQETIQKSAASLKTTVQEVKVPNFNEVTEAVKDTFKKKGKNESVTECSIIAISTNAAIKIIYYLIAADGEINKEEEKQFDEICNELSPDFAKTKDNLIAECKAELSKVIEDGDYYDTLQDAMEKALIESKPSADAYITPKLLLWDLLSIAYSDNKYNEEEHRLLKHLVRKLDVDKSVFLELENSMLTVMDIEKEIRWLKTTNRPYLTIESMVNELAERKNVVFESVKDIIAL